MTNSSFVVDDKGEFTGRESTTFGHIRSGPTCPQHASGVEELVSSSIKPAQGYTVGAAVLDRNRASGYCITRIRKLKQRHTPRPRADRW